MNGVAVAIHDATLDRTTDGSGPVAECTVEALRALDAGGGERIPTLDQILEEFPRTPVILEVKEVTVAAATAECLRRHGAAERVLVGSFVMVLTLRVDYHRWRKWAGPMLAA